MEFLRREVLVAANVSLFATFLQVIFMAYLGIHLNTFQAAALIIGFVLGMRNFVQIFLRIPIGEFSQVVGRKPLLLIGMTFYSLAHLLLYFSTSWLYDLFATILLAIGMAFHYPSLFAYIGDISVNNYGKINGFVFQGSDIAIIISTFIVKELLENETVTLSGVFLSSFFIGIIGVMINFFLMRETLLEHERTVVVSKFQSLISSFKNSFRSFKSLSGIENLKPVYRFQLIISFGEFFFQSSIGLLVFLSLGYEKSDVAAILSFGTLLLFPLKPFLGSISDRFGFKKPVIFSLAFNGLLLIIITQMTELWMLTVIYSIYMANNMTSYLGVNGATSYNSDNEKRGVAMGVLGVYVSIGRTLSSVIMGLVWEVLTRFNGDKGKSLIIVFQITGVLLIIASIFLHKKYGKI